MRLLTLSLLLLAASASAQSTYFVAPNGSPLGSGAITSPLTLPAALGRVAPGDTVFVRGLSEGQQVVVSALNVATNGMQIRVPETGSNGATARVETEVGEN